MNYNVLITGMILMLITGIFIFYEKKKPFAVESSKEIVLIATLAAFAGISRIPFMALPNIQPTTFIIIVSGYVFGPIFGFLVGGFATLISSSFLGYGPYVVWQVFAWGLCGLSGGIYRKLFPKYNHIFFIGFCFIWGFIYDYIMNIWHYMVFVYPHTVKTFLTVFAYSFLFDFLHGLGNSIFAIFFAKELIKILDRFKAKLYIEKKDFNNFRDGDE